MSAETEKPRPPGAGDQPAAARGPRRPLLSGWGLLILMAGLCAMIVLGSVFGIPWFIALTGGDLLKKAERAFGRVLQLTPVTTIKGDSVVLEKSAIAELAVVQRKTQIVIKYESQWLNSTKLMIVRADFIVKAGFNLSQDFRFSVKQPEREVIVELPKPRILGVTLQNYEIIFSSDGIINKLQPADQETVVNQLLARARQDAERSDLALEAQQQIEQRLRDLLQDTEAKVTVRFLDPSPPPQPPKPGRAA